MMRKYVSRLLALVLVLSMVVLCVPVRVQAVEPVRPEGYTDEEWAAYLLKLKLLEEAKKNNEALTDADTIAENPETGNVVVSEQVPVTGAPTDAANQTVSVEVPLEAEEISDNKTKNEYETTLPATDSAPAPTEVTVVESYDLEASATVETTADGEVTDIEYEISLNEHIEAKDGETTVANGNVTDLDKALNTKTQDPSEFKVDMSINGMDDKKVTRVTHTYTTPKETTTPGESTEETHVEYYYNAENGTEDTTKKYFTITEVETEKAGTGGALEKVKEKVVSLWTSFLGIFHITNDAFEGADKTTYGSLDEAAAADANTGKTVEMLRDYETGTTATISNGVTVDMNGHAYTNTSDNTAINVSGTGTNVSIEDGSIISNGDGVAVSGTNQKFSLKNIFLRSNADENASGNTAALKVSGSGNTVSIDDDTYISGSNSTYGIQVAGSGKNTLNITDSDVEGKTGVSLKNADANISGSYVAGTTGAAVAVDGNPKDNDVIITSGWFESGKNAADISAKDKDDIASITVKGGRFTDPTGLYSYIPSGYAAISHNDGSYFLYEVVGTDYIPTRDGYRFLGYTDGNGNAITLAEAARKDVIAYAQWKEIPETAAKESPLIVVKTDEKGCTTKVTIKGDTAYVTVKDKDGEYVPISEVTVTSIKKLQNKGVDTIEVQVDEDVTLVLDIEKAKENGFTDTIEVNLEKDTLLITSGKKTCIELDIAVLKAADKPVEIQLVEGELTVLLGKNSSMSVDLTKALKTGERIVVKLENGVLKLYDKYNKPIKD